MNDLPFVEAAVLKGVLVVSRLGEVARRKLAFVRDDQAALAQRLDIGLQRRRVHCDEHVGLVARRLDRGRAEVDLEGRDSEGRALRRADFSREVGEGREIVPGECGRERELSAGQLHAVAAVSGEADHDGFLWRMRRCFLVGEKMGGCRHVWVLYRREFWVGASLGL